MTLADPASAAALTGYGTFESLDGATATLRVPRADTAAVAARLLADLPIADVSIEDPPVEEVVRAVFAGA